MACLPFPLANRRNSSQDPAMELSQWFMGTGRHSSARRFTAADQHLSSVSIAANNDRLRNS